VAIVAEKFYAGSIHWLAENFALLDKISIFLHIIYSLAIFSLGCIKPPWGDAPSLVPFLARLSYMKHLVFAVILSLRRCLASRLPWGRKFWCLSLTPVVSVFHWLASASEKLPLPRLGLGLTVSVSTWYASALARPDSSSPSSDSDTNSILVTYFHVHSSRSIITFYKSFSSICCHALPHPVSLLPRPFLASHLNCLGSPYLTESPCCLKPHHVQNYGRHPISDCWE